MLNVLLLADVLRMEDRRAIRKAWVAARRIEAMSYTVRCCVLVLGDQKGELFQGFKCHVSAYVVISTSL